MWVSVDPGQVHVGVAIWEEEDLQHVSELTPDGFKLWFQEALSSGSVDKLIIESFSLHSPKFGKKVAAEAVDTIELIGAAKMLCALHNVPVYTQQPAVRNIAMKGPWYATLKKSGYWGAPLRNDHIASAVAHGLYHYHFKKERV